MFKVISLIGFSGSGKTYFITRAIQLLKSEFDLNVACIKNVHHHRIDEEGKDSRLFTEAGASYSIIKNQFNEHAIFIKKEIEIETIIEWLRKAPIKIDLLFIEGFRKVNYPSILCVKEIDEIETQKNPNVKMISGIISLDDYEEKVGVPFVNIDNDFQKFLKLFDIH